MVRLLHNRAANAFTQHCFFKSKKSSAGFSLVEVVVTFAIIAILFAIALGSFLPFQRTNILSREARSVASVIEDARARTLFSENDTQYGVHFDTSEVTLFAGSVYNETDPLNEVMQLDGAIISDTNFIGGSDIVFKRITGEALAYGTTTLQLSAEPLQELSVRILPSGIIEFVN